MLIPKEHKIDFLKEHKIGFVTDDYTVKYYIETFEESIAVADITNMVNEERRELLHYIIVFRMIKILEDHCE